MANLKNVIYLSNEDYETLVTTGSVTINGTTLTYDEDNVYITPETTATTSSDGLMSASDKSKLDSIDSGAQANAVTDVRVSGTSILSNKIANIVTNTAYSATNNKIATMADLPTDYIVSGSASYLKSASTSGNTLTLVYGNNTTVNFVNTTYDSKSAVSGGTDLSLVTTGEKYTWNNKGNVSSVDNVSPSSGNVALNAVRYTSQSLTDTQKEQARTNIEALNKIPLEWNKSLSNGSNGKVCLGKFFMYDSNVTIEMSLTTSTTFKATLVIATQNMNRTTSSGLIIANVYDDAENAITPLLSIFRPNPNTANGSVEVYANLPGWSKCLVHVRAIGLESKTETGHETASYAYDILTTVSSIPTTITGKTAVTSTNKLRAIYYLASNPNEYTSVTSSTVSGWGFTKNAGTVTNVGAGTGLSISGTSSVNPTVNIASGYKLPTTTEWNSKADTSSVPTKTSQLTNDSNFATTSQIPTATSDLTNDSGFITSADIPTKTSELTNDSGFITSSDLPTNHVTTNTAQDITGQKTIIGQTRIKGSAAAGSADNTTNGFQFWKYGTTSYNKTSTDYLGLISPNDSGALGFYGRTALYFRPVITNGTVNTNYGVTMDSTGLFPGSTVMPLGKSSNPWGHIYSQNQTISGYLTDGSHYWNLPTSGGSNSGQPSRLVDTNDSRLSDSRTPTAHASTATTYGIGTASNYGHVKLTSGDLNGVAASDGIAANVGHTHSQYAQASNVYSKSEIDTQIQNVTEIAEGKTKTYAINDTTTGTNVINSQFSSTNDDISIGNSGTNKIKDTQGNEILLSDLNVGDIILITQVDVPDRWVSTVGSGSGSTVFSKLESTKSDISNMVSASSTLTSNQIILGGGNKSVSASGKTISTSVANNDTTVPTGKAVQTYVTRLGYITTVTPTKETITVFDSSVTNPIATTTINGIASAGSTPTLGHTEYTWSAGSVPTRAQFTYATGGFSTAANLVTTVNNFTKGTTPTLTGTYTASSKNFAISFDQGSVSNITNNASIDVSSFKSVDNFVAPVLATTTAYQITGVGSVPSLKNGTTEATTVSNISSWNAGTIPTIASSTTVVTGVTTTTKEIVTGVSGS